MKVAIHQPQYLPWLGYFDKIDQADVFVLLDDVQYKKNEWQNRNKIRNADSWQWITVPVINKFGLKIKEIKISDTNWAEKHLRSIELNYSNAEFFNENISIFREILAQEWENLAELNVFFIKHIMDILEINTELIRSSQLDIKTEKTDRLIDICKVLKADSYLSGAGGKDYLDIEVFERSSIELQFQEYTHPEYKQVFNGFVPFMSVIDLLFCSGKDSLNVVREGRKQ